MDHLIFFQYLALSSAFRLTDGVTRIIIFLYKFLPNSYATACFDREKDDKRLSSFEPMSVELHQTGTFRTLYRLSYSAAASWINLLEDMKVIFGFDNAELLVDDVLEGVAISGWK